MLKLEALLLVVWTNCTAIIRMPASDLWSRKESYFTDDYSPIQHTLWLCCNIESTINVTIQYSNGCRQQVCIHNCSQTAADRDIHGHYF